jgi:hypothetical protein
MTLSRRQKREEARRLFLTGEADTNAEIARRLHMKASTVARYRQEEGWDDLRLRVDRQAAEKLVESLAGERTSLNLRHFRYWDLALSKAGDILKVEGMCTVQELDRLTAIIERAQKGQRLARGLSLTGENEEQIRAQAQAQARGLVDAFVGALKEHVPDEIVRDRIRLAVLERAPGFSSKPEEASP